MTRAKKATALAASGVALASASLLSFTTVGSATNVPVAYQSKHSVGGVSQVARAASSEGGPRFSALRRASTPADAQFGSDVAPQIANLIAEDDLNVSEARVVISGPDGTAALIPGNGTVCFVSRSPLLGVVASCMPASSVSYQGYGIMGTIRGKTLVQGVVPDAVSGVRFALSGGQSADMSLGADNGYSQILDARGIAISYLGQAGLLGSNDLGNGSPRGYLE